jgi:hypothetical protein
VKYGVCNIYEGKLVRKDLMHLYDEEITLRLVVLSNLIVYFNISS